jgi:hypothetical protein
LARRTRLHMNKYTKQVSEYALGYVLRGAGVEAKARNRSLLKGKGYPAGMEFRMRRF